MIVRLHRFIAFAILLAWCIASPSMHAAQPRTKASREYEVKAVFLYNFARFVEWPVERGKDAEVFVIGVLGDDPFGELLDEAVRGERVGSRRLQVKRVAGIEEATQCDQVFIARSEQHRLGEILKQLGTRPILTVSDIPQFAEQGGIVGLVSSGGRTKIRINLEAAKAAELSISSKLLRPAEIVTTRKTTRHKRFGDPGRLAKSLARDPALTPVGPILVR